MLRLVRPLFPSVLRMLASIVLTLLFSACATLSPVRPRDLLPSYALAEPRTTSLGRLFASYVEQHADKSGFAIVGSGREAFMARYAFAALAEKTIDAQYYLWEEDTTGRILFSALMKAASRGVRVRLLLDDLNTVGKDYALAILTAHPNIQVRLYNPFIERSFRGWDALFNFVRINHRMHNKAFIVDNVVAIVGGRNIGDNYFAVDEQSNFRDLDLFAGGPIVHDVSESFDAFWNSAWALPVQAFVNGQPTLEQFHKLAAALDTTAVDYKNLPFPLETDPEALTAFAKNVPARLIWGEATVLADRPDKPSTAESEVLAGLRQKFGGTLNRELLLEVAYFVPGNRGVKSLCALTARGVRIRVLTNSFASNDVALVHAGYVKYRKELLRCGVELTELQPLAGFIRREWRWLKGKSKAALHTKAAVFDRHAVFIGSFNLDPRSASLNTELAIVVESPALATEVVRFIEAGMQPSNAYHVELDRHGGLQWTATEHGKTVHFTHEPHTTLWRSLIVKSLLLLPIEGQL